MNSDDAPTAAPEPEIIPPSKPSSRNAEGKTQIQILEEKLAKMKAAEARNGNMTTYHANTDPERMATKPFVATEAQRNTVREMAGAGVGERHIAAIIYDLDGKPISVNTLREHFQKELDEPLGDAIKKVGAALLRKATGKHLDMAGVRAAEVFLRCKAAWRDEATPQKVEVTGKDGGAIEHQHQHEHRVAVLGEIRTTLIGLRQLLTAGPEENHGLVTKRESETASADG